MSSMIVCNTCKKAKPLEEFHVRKRSANGRQANCKQCNRDQATLANWRNAGLEFDWGKYRALSDRQGGRCAICGRTPKESGSKERELAVDHIHGTNIVRALLCMDCNTALGKMRDDPVLLRKAAEYIEHHAAQKEREHLVESMNRAEPGATDNPGDAQRI